MPETIFWWVFTLACVFAFFFSYGMVESIAVSWFFSAEGDIRQNSPTVQIEANMVQDRLWANIRIGRRV